MHQIIGTSELPCGPVLVWGKSSTRTSDLMKGLKNPSCAEYLDRVSRGKATTLALMQPPAGYWQELRVDSRWHNDQHTSARSVDLLPHLQRAGAHLLDVHLSLCVWRHKFNLMASRGHKAQEYTEDQTKNEGITSQATYCLGKVKILGHL